MAPKPKCGIWHWSPAPPEHREKRLDGLKQLCSTAANAGLDYIAFKSNDGAADRFLTDDQLATAKAACQQHGLGFVLWQYVYAKRPPSEEAKAFADVIKRFDPEFAFIDVEVEYEKAPGPVSQQYASAFRTHLPHFPATVAPFGRADLHPGIDYKAWHDHGFGVAPQAYQCENPSALKPAQCANSFSKFWPIKQQWVVVGLHQTHSFGRMSGPDLAASLRGLPIQNVSGWYSGDFTVDQLRGIATHTGPVHKHPVPAFSIKTAQEQLAACGFDVEPTGQLDAATRDAVTAFQMAWCGHLGFKQVSGKFSPRTRLALAWAARHNGTLGPKAKNFRFQEFRLDNKGDPHVRRSVALAAQAYRKKFGPTTILRSASTREHNKAVGGASDSRHLFPDHFDAIDMMPQDQPVNAVSGLHVWTGIGHHAASGLVDHTDLRPGDPQHPLVFPDH